MITTEDRIEELKGIIEATETKELDRLNYRLSDAIREGSRLAPQATGWGEGETMCALHAAVVSASARGYM